MFQYATREMAERLHAKNLAATDVGHVTFDTVTDFMVYPDDADPETHPGIMVEWNVHFDDDGNEYMWYWWLDASDNTERYVPENEARLNGWDISPSA